jgi:hypothetical protein
MRQRQGAEFCSILNATEMDAPASGIQFPLPFQRRRSFSAIAIDAPASGAESCSITNAGVQALAKWMRECQGADFCPFPTPAPWDPIRPLEHDPPRRVNPEITPKCSATNHPAYLETIFRFGVLQLRLHRFERLHLEVVASKVGYLNMLQDRVCALFIL